MWWPTYLDAIEKFKLTTRRDLDWKESCTERNDYNVTHGADTILESRKDARAQLELVQLECEFPDLRDTRIYHTEQTRNAMKLTGDAHDCISKERFSSFKNK